MKYGDKVVDQAEKYIGTVERPDGSNRGTGFIDDCQNYWKMGHGTTVGPQPWCAMAASKWYRDAGVDDEGLFSPSTQIMCENAARNGIRRYGNNETIPAGAVIVKCGVHTEVVKRDLGNGILECIGGNTSNGVFPTRRAKSEWRIYGPKQILEETVAPTKMVYWFEDPKKMAKNYGGWRTAKTRDKNLANFLKANPNLRGRIRKVKKISGVAPYMFQVIPPKGSSGGVSGYYDTAAARNKAKAKYEASHDTKVRIRSKRIFI